MAYRHTDMPDVFMALESALGANTGVNGFAWQVESVTGTGPENARVYYVVAQKFAGFSAGHNFGIVEVTIVPGTPRHSAFIYTTTYYTTMDAAVTQVGTLVSALNPETSQVPGALAATNS